MGTTCYDAWDAKILGLSLTFSAWHMYKVGNAVASSILIY